METYQIIALVLLIIFIVTCIMAHITMIMKWNNIHVGDTGTYTNEIEGWHILNIKVVEKYDEYMVIEYADNCKETVYRYEYLDQHKTFNWDKDGKID